MRAGPVFLVLFFTSAALANAATPSQTNSTIPRRTQALSPAPVSLEPPPDETPEPLPQEAPETTPVAAVTTPSPSPSPSPTVTSVPSLAPGKDTATPFEKQLQVVPSPKPVTDPVKQLSDLTSPLGVKPEVNPTPAPENSPAPDETPSVDRIEPPPKPEELPIYLRRVDTLLRQHDESMAISYLRRIVPNGILSPRDRSQAIIELADCLTDSQQQGEALVWLRLWTGLYSTRPEAGAVDFRVGCLYEYMHMPREARDTFYLALSATVNQSKIQDSLDLDQYSCLTADILWKMAENEYACGEFARAAQLFDRYLREATAASAQSKEQAQFLEADANYQLHDVKNSTALYEKAISSHPFNPLVPEARLRLYHLYILQNRVADAEGDLKALAWTVRTVWPGDEVKWQKRALELLLEINKGDPGLQVPILAAAGQLHVGSELQDELDHYTQLNALQDQDVPIALQRSSDKKVELNEIRGEDLKIDTLSQSINHLLPNE